MSADKSRPSAGPPSERQLAKQLGLSRPFMWRAKKVAEIPADIFEHEIESDKVTTVTQLVALSHGPAVRNRGPNRSAMAEELISLAEDVRRLAVDASRSNPEQIALSKDWIAIRLLRLARRVEGGRA